MKFNLNHHCWSWSLKHQKWKNRNPLCMFFCLFREFSQAQSFKCACCVVVNGFNLTQTKAFLTAIVIVFRLLKSFAHFRCCLAVNGRAPFCINNSSRGMCWLKINALTKYIKKNNACNTWQMLLCFKERFFSLCVPLNGVIILLHVVLMHFTQEMSCMWKMPTNPLGIFTGPQNRYVLTSRDKWVHGIWRKYMA